MRLPRPQTTYGHPIGTNRGTVTGVSRPSRVLVPLQRNSPDQPCVCVLSMGPPTHEGLDRMATYQQQAESQGCAFVAIEINGRDVDTDCLIIKQVPEDSTVVILAGQPVPDISAEVFSHFLIGADIRPPSSSPPMDAGSLAAQQVLDDLPERVRQHRLNVSTRHAHTGSAGVTLYRRPTSGAHGSTHPYIRPGSSADHSRPTGSSGFFANFLRQFASPQQPHSLAYYLANRSPRPTTSSTGIAPVAQQASPPTPLAVLDRWLALPPTVTQSPVWQELVDPSPVTGKLAELFSDLHKADPDGRKGLKALLSTVAHTMAIDRDFAAQVLALAPDVERVCADRVSYTAYQLQTALMVHVASAPGVPMDDVIAIARQVYRRRWIYETAHAKVKAINQGKGDHHPASHTEELETQWAYVIHFTRQGLDLGGTVKHQGRFISEVISKVNTQDAQHALSRLKADEAEHFDDFLALWTPWQSYLRRALPHAVEALEATLVDADRAEQFDQEAIRQFQNIGIDPGTAPADVRQLANQLSKQDERARWKRLTQRAIDAHDEQRHSRWETLSSTRSRSPSPDPAPRTPAVDGLLRV